MCRALAVVPAGLNDEIAKALAESSGNKRWAYDCYRRFLQMFANVVMGQSIDNFEAVIHRIKKEKGYSFDCEITGDEWEAVTHEFKALAKVPTEPYQQLDMAIQAVFNSWCVTSRART